MAFAGKPGKALSRSAPLKPSPLKPRAGLKSATQKKPSLGLERPFHAADDEKKALQRATLRALTKARADAAAAGVDLSDWESAFIEDVSERVKIYGRAFADPDKGAVNGTLSLRQGIKLREIRKKARKSKPNATS